MDKQNIDPAILNKMISAVLATVESDAVDEETKKLARKSLKSTMYIVSEITEVIESVVKEIATPETKEVIKGIVGQVVGEVMSNGDITSILSQLKSR